MSWGAALGSVLSSAADSASSGLTKFMQMPPFRGYGEFMRGLDSTQQNNQDFVGPPTRGYRHGQNYGDIVNKFSMREGSTIFDLMKYIKSNRGTY